MLPNLPNLPNLNNSGKWPKASGLSPNTGSTPTFATFEAHRPKLFVRSLSNTVSSLSTTSRISRYSSRGFPSERSEAGLQSASRMSWGQEIHSLRIRNFTIRFWPV